MKDPIIRIKLNWPCQKIIYFNDGKYVFTQYISMYYVCLHEYFTTRSIWSFLWVLYSYHFLWPYSFKLGYVSTHPLFCLNSNEVNDLSSCMESYFFADVPPPLGKKNLMTYMYSYYQLFNSCHFTEGVYINLKRTKTLLEIASRYEKKFDNKKTLIKILRRLIHWS